MWMNLFRGGMQDGEVAPEGGVLVHGVNLRFADAKVALHSGTRVKVWVDFHFLCAESAELEKRELARKEAAAQEARERQAAHARRHAEDQLFNQALRVPVAWTVGLKDVLSGLSENSDGSGRNRASVNHILLLADLAYGRIQRKAGDLLCTSGAQTNGKNWSDQRGERQGRVTCARCLSLSKKWTQEL